MNQVYSSRQALTFQEKDAVREFKLMNPKATQHQCRIWFYKTFNKKITQSTISEILSKGSSSDSQNGNKNTVVVRNPRRQRKTSSKYAELDTPLYMTAVKLQNSGSELTYPLLQQLATQLWPSVYGDSIPPPNISVGMMQRFADRNNLTISRMRNKSKCARKSSKSQGKSDSEDSQDLNGFHSQSEGEQMSEVSINQDIVHVSAPQTQQIGTYPPLQAPCRHQQYPVGVQFAYSEGMIPVLSNQYQHQHHHHHHHHHASIQSEYPESPSSLITDTSSTYTPPILSPQGFNQLNYMAYNNMSGRPVPFDSKGLNSHPTPQTAQYDQPLMNVLNQQQYVIYDNQSINMPNSSASYNSENMNMPPPTREQTSQLPGVLESSSQAMGTYSIGSR